MNPSERLQVPAPDRLAAVQKIADLTDPYLFSPNHPELIVEAMRESIRWHASRSDFYRKVVASAGFDPSTLRTIADLHRVPIIPAHFFKTHELLSVPPKDVHMHFTSSGTTGLKSQVFFDRWSFTAGQRMVDSTFLSLGFVTPEQKTNYLLYSYETASDSKLGTAYTDNYLCRYAPVENAFCALRRTGTGTHDFDVFGCIEHLQRYAKQRLPVRIFGFPAFLYFTLQRMRALQLPRLSLHPESLVFLGGGWKGYANQEVSKDELYSAIVDGLGIPDAQIRDSFGAVEHPIPYAECPQHHFHVPVWSHVIIRDVRTLEPCDFGQPGFLQFLTPFITSMPVQSVLMGDLATLHPGESCGCGITRPYFKVLGRAGTSKNKSCAVAAAEMLGR